MHLLICVCFYQDGQILIYPKKLSIYHYIRWESTFLLKNNKLKKVFRNLIWTSQFWVIMVFISSQDHGFSTVKLCFDCLKGLLGSFYPVPAIWEQYIQVIKFLSCMFYVHLCVILQHGISWTKLWVKSSLNHSLKYHSWVWYEALQFRRISVSILTTLWNLSVNCNNQRIILRDTI